MEHAVSHGVKKVAGAVAGKVAGIVAGSVATVLFSPESLGDDSWAGALADEQRKRDNMMRHACPQIEKDSNGSFILRNPTTGQVEHVVPSQYFTQQAEYQLKAGQVEEPLLPEVLSFLQTTQEVSISLLQRRFKIGYNRSARLIEILEMQGKVMPSDGAKMRKVIK